MCAAGWSCEGWKNPKHLINQSILKNKLKAIMKTDSMSVLKLKHPMWTNVWTHERLILPKMKLFLPLLPSAISLYVWRWSVFFILSSDLNNVLETLQPGWKTGSWLRFCNLLQISKVNSYFCEEIMMPQYINIIERGRHFEDIC